MGITNDLKEMMNSRLAYKLWPVKDDYDRMVFSDKRNLVFVRIMTLLFTILPVLGICYLFMNEKDVPIPVFLLLGFFSLAFFFTFLFKSLSHVEVEFTNGDKKILVSKKRFNTTLKEQQFNFSQVKKINLSEVGYRQRRERHAVRIRSNYEIVMELNGDKNIHFSAISASDAALAQAKKIAGFVGAKLADHTS